MAKETKKNKPRTITRTYVSKKTGEVITKTYTYDYTQKQGASLKKRTQKIWADSSITTKTKLITKGGKLNVSRLEEVSLHTGIDKSVLKAIIQGRHRDTKKAVPATAVLSFLQHNRVERFLLNLGVSINELVNELSIINPIYDRAYVLDERHWEHVGDYQIEGPLVLSEGGVVEFVWDYYIGSTWEIVGV